MKYYHIIVKGRVQGVGYRYSAKSKASSLKLKGSVKNLENGSVEIFCLGSNEKTKEFIDYCKNNPGWSKVENIDIQEVTDKIIKEKLEQSISFEIN
jgi:acylphosphatase